jgi:cobalt-zinc-cadmium efflux system membrane fusion protein
MSRRTLVVCLVPILLAGCAGDAPDRADANAGERPTVAVTRWSERTELFLEYPVLVAGESGRAAVHLTDLRDFTPLRVGEATVTLRAGDGRVLEFRGGPSRPGIFGLDLEADRPGTYAMSLRVVAPGLEDAHELGPVTVYPAGETPAEPEEEEDEEISFLKEQQWTLEFGTAPAETRTLRASVTVPAVIEARPGGDAELTAPVPGRIDPAVSVPAPGTAVRAGAVLARILPRSDDLRDAGALRAAVVEAEQAHDLAVREQERVERLVAARALPSRRRDEARADLAASAARRDAARQRWRRFEALSQAGPAGAAEGAFVVRAPFPGVITDVRFALGGSVDESDVLLRLVDPDRVHVVGSVSESAPADLRRVVGGELLVDGEAPVALSRPASVGRVLEPASRTTEVRFTYDNAKHGLPVGQSVQLRLLLSSAVSGTAIPESAVVDDGGRPVAFVQTGGESFERRPVRLGAREGGWVHVLEGVTPGERVVHRGAYLVRLAAMSTQIPAHGHVH